MSSPLPTATGRGTATDMAVIVHPSAPDAGPFVGTTEAVQADLEDLASRAAPTAGLVADRYFIGPLDVGVPVFGGEELLAREGEDEAVWFGKSPIPESCAHPTPVLSSQPFGSCP